MRRDGRAALRRRLVRIVTQAWLLGAVGGTLLDAALLSWLLTSMFAKLGLFAFLIPPAALAVSAPPFLLGLGLVLAAPDRVVRHRLPLCVGMPAVVTAVWLALTPPSHDADRQAAALVFLDAALAAAWCWHRTKGLAAQPAPDLAARFE